MFGLKKGKYIGPLLWLFVLVRASNLVDIPPCIGGGGWDSFLSQQIQMLTSSGNTSQTHPGMMFYQQLSSVEVHINWTHLSSGVGQSGEGERHMNDPWRAMEVSGHRGSLGFPRGGWWTWRLHAAEGQGAAGREKGRPCRLKEQEAQTLEEEVKWWSGPHPFSLSVMCWLLPSAQHWADLNLRMGKKSANKDHVLPSQMKETGTDLDFVMSGAKHTNVT